MLAETMTPGKWLSVALAVGGVLVLGLSRHSGAQGRSPPVGVMLALLSSVSAAVYKVGFKLVMP